MFLESAVVVVVNCYMGATAMMVSVGVVQLKLIPLVQRMLQYGLLST